MCKGHSVGSDWYKEHCQVVALAHDVFYKLACNFLKSVNMLAGLGL
jgi:hypothetical protein